MQTKFVLGMSREQNAMYCALNIQEELQAPLRNLIISVNKDRLLPPELFHRLQNGINNPNLPGIRYRPSAILGIGTHSARLVQLQAITLIDLLSKKLEKDIQWSLQSGSCSLRVLPDLLEYKITGMIISTDHGSRKRLFGERSGREKIFAQGKPTLDSEAEDVLIKTIRNSFVRQAEDLLNIDFPEEAILGDVKIQKEQIPIKIPESSARYTRADLVFRSNLLFTGPWACGGFTHKGFGQIYRTYSERSMQRSGKRA